MPAWLFPRTGHKNPFPFPTWAEAPGTGETPEEMETAAYDYLKLTLGKKEALALYYRLTAFLREHDAAGFGRFMAFKDGASLKDEALMGFVLGLMADRHRATLAQWLPAMESDAGA